MSEHTDSTVIRKAFKFRLDVSPEQHQRLVVLMGCARYTWNAALAECELILNAKQSLPGYNGYGGYGSWITYWKDLPDSSFLKDGYTDNLQQKLMDLDRAWKDCFDKTQPEKKRPRFKSKHKDDDNSIRFVNFNKYCKLDNRRVKLPSGMGWCRFRKSRDIVGEIKNCTISRKGAHWFISFQTEISAAIPVHVSRSSVGIDVGIAKFVTTSNGDVIKPINTYRKYEKQLAREQRKLAKKVKFSANWRKQKTRINKLHSKIANIRKDFLHKASTQLSKSHAMIVIEDLRTKNMSSSAKGTVESPGKNVKAKSGLNKSILDQGWYEFRRQLEYKQAWAGGDVVAVPAHHTSQTCPSCNHVSRDNRKTQANFCCVSCGYHGNADVIAAINILARGQRVLACGESSLEDLMKQEPVLTRKRKAPRAAHAA